MTLVAAAVSASARSDVLADFTQATAFSPTNAIPYTPRRGFQERWFSRLQKEGVIKSAGAGRFYLDQVEAAHSLGRRRALKAAAVAGVMGVLATMLLIG